MKHSHVALTIAAVLVSALLASPTGIAADVPAPSEPNGPAAAASAVPFACTPLPLGRVVPQGWLGDWATARLTFETGDVPASIDVAAVQRSTSPTMKDLGKRVRLLFDVYMSARELLTAVPGTR